MGVVDLRSGTDRYVLFLENPTSVYRTRLEGDIRNRVDLQIDKFLTSHTPESAFEAEDKFPSPLRQLKDRGGKARALGTWCQGESYDLFILQVLFDKDDEDKVYAKTGAFQARGKDLEEKFSEMTEEEITAKVTEWEDRDDLRLCIA